MQIAVLGVAGFIGSNLTDKLLEMGHSVVGVDNLSSGRSENLAPLSSNEQFLFLQQDINNPIRVDGPVDFVLHLASLASPADYFKFPIETLKVGSIGTLNALELAREKKARFLLTSTSEVYGDPQVNPQPEDYWGNVNPIGRRAPYDESKRFAESLTMAYHWCHGLDTRIVRIFNTYGPRMRADDGRVVPTLINQALHNIPMTAFGDGTQTRSFCYITDTVDAIVRLMAASYPYPINVGNPQELTILELARNIQRMTGTRNSIEFRPLPQDDPKSRKPDITRASQVLGWAPTVSLEEGLRSTIDWFAAKVPAS